MNLPKMEDCIARRLYKIDCRNLSYGVWNGKDGFIGIRTKFNQKYLFTEYHWDTGEPYGTVFEAIDTGIDVPDKIELKERGPIVDKITQRLVAQKPQQLNIPISVATGIFMPSNNNDAYAWYFLDTGECSKHIRPVSSQNQQLFDWITEIIS